MRLALSPLDLVSRQARPYPADALPEGGTALALFAAAFLGHNDSIHFARKRMTGTCVDVDAERLAEMAAIYPDDWTFVVEDAWEFAISAAERGERWDVVSVDTFTGTATEESLRTLTLWTAIAEQLVTATIRNEQTYRTPDGWRASLFPRAPEVSWLVLRRD